MKAKTIYTLLFIFTLSLLTSCGFASGQSNTNNSKVRTYYQDKMRTGISVYEIEGCEYIGMMAVKYDGISVSIIHKHNCKYCKSRK